MSNVAAKLDILIDIQARLAELMKTQQGFREAKQEAASFGTMLKQGLGIGTGIEIARRGIEMIKSVLVESTREAFRLAGQLKDTSENLQISTEALQVLGITAEDGGSSMEKLTQALVNLKRATADAKTGAGTAATVFNELGLNATRLSSMPLERQLEAVARAVFSAKDQSKAFNQALEILGGRTAPQLMNALRDLAGEGYDKLAASVRQSGRIMEEDTIARLDRAQKQIERLKRSMVIFAGESIASLSKLLGMGGGATAPSTALQPSEDFWTQFNRDSLRAGQSELNILKERFALQQRMAANTMFPTLSNNVAITLLDKIRDRLAENIRLAAEELPEAFRKLSTMKQGQFPTSVVELFPANRRSTADGMTDIMRGLSDENLKKIEAVNKALAEFSDIQKEIRDRQAPRSAFTEQRRQFEGVEAPRVNSGFLTPAQGMVSGAMQWATDLGSQGQQVASTINATIGESVRGISQGIYGWATGTRSWGESLQQIGASVFQMMLQMLVQIGAQQALNFILLKTGLVAADALQSGLIAKKVVEVNAANAATLPGNTANAAASSVSSFGLAAVLGIAALLAVMAMFGGFREHGGEVTPGRAYVVGERGPEIMIPSGAGRIVPNSESFTRRSPGLGSSSPVAATKPRMLLMKPSTQAEFDALRRLPDWDVQVVDTVMRHRGAIVNA